MIIFSLGLSCGFLRDGFNVPGCGSFGPSAGLAAGIEIVETSILSGLAIVSRSLGHNKHLTPTKCRKITAIRINNKVVMLSDHSLSLGFGISTFCLRKWSSEHSTNEVTELQKIGSPYRVSLKIDTEKVWDCCY
ncbi:hypothetical protein [Methylomonas albis]|uniref:hypothetical protein n=1 Tax=Methylomonas albis TaxID=1854563 RepID=UPI0019E0C4F3|nr:hypothetical protein [Methylomonas albis]CAD6878861.1 hypothetical protein [Methylomonas albis]